MKLNKETVTYLSSKVVEYLAGNEMIECEDGNQVATEIVESAIIEDLMVEDQLNDEVKEILRDQEDTIDENNINYRKMFQMIKNKLARERGLIL